MQLRKILFISLKVLISFKLVVFSVGNCFGMLQNQIGDNLILQIDSVRVLFNMEDIICERGDTYFEFEVESDDLVEIFSRKEKFKKYEIYSEPNREFFRLDITIESRNEVIPYVQLIRISKYMLNKIKKCTQGDKLTIRIKEYFNGNYFEVVKEITVK